MLLGIEDVFGDRAWDTFRDLSGNGRIVVCGNGPVRFERGPEIDKAEIVVRCKNYLGVFKESHAMAGRKRYAFCVSPWCRI